jgi:hypothetical protein
MSSSKNRNNEEIMLWGVALNKKAYPYMLIVNQRILIFDNKKFKIFTTKDKLEIL